MSTAPHLGDGSSDVPTTPEVARDAQTQGDDAEAPMDAGEAMEALEGLRRDAASLETIRAFIKAHPALLTAKRPPYGSALAWALEFAHEDIARELMAAGSDPCAESRGDTGALALAARGGLTDFIRDYLAAGHACAETSYWGTPLHFAARYGHVDAARILLDAGADVNARAEDFTTTPLMRAATEGHAEMIELLLAAGAQLEARDANGRTPLHWAVFASRPVQGHEWSEDRSSHSSYELDPGPALALDALLRAGADASARDEEGKTPLHHAAELNAARAIPSLLRHGASRRAKDAQGRTPRDIARKRERQNVLDLL